MALTVQDVQAWGGFTVTDAEAPLLVRILAAVIERIESDYYVSDPLTDSQEQAVLMQTYRLWQRRSSPEGIAQIGEFGPITVRRVDPDIESMLSKRWRFA